MIESSTQQRRVDSFLDKTNNSLLSREFSSSESLIDNLTSVATKNEITKSLGGINKIGDLSINNSDLESLKIAVNNGDFSKKFVELMSSKPLPEKVKMVISDENGISKTLSKSVSSKSWLCGTGGWYFKWVSFPDSTPRYVGQDFWTACLVAIWAQVVTGQPGVLMFLRNCDVPMIGIELPMNW